MSKHAYYVRIEVVKRTQEGKESSPAGVTIVADTEEQLWNYFDKLTASVRPTPHLQLHCTCCGDPRDVIGLNHCFKCYRAGCESMPVYTRNLPMCKTPRSLNGK
jgi:hypothetical protein